MNGNKEGQARVKAYLLDWAIWAYLPAAVIYFLRDYTHELPITLWLYLACVLIGAVVALIMEAKGISIGERVSELAPKEVEEEQAQATRTPWHKTQVGWTAMILGVVTFVLGWQITQINLYYVFTRADRMTNMTERLLRPYWPVFGSLIEKMIETIFLALMATAFSIPLAAVISFFAARNIMYRLTAKWGKVQAIFILAVLGAVLGVRLVGALTGSLQGSFVDTDLLGGILSPVAWLLGALLGGLVGARGMAALLRRGAARVASLALSMVLGAGAAYVLASVISMVVFAASWRIFVRELSPWPYVVLAVGMVAGLLLGLRWHPDDDFRVGPLIYGVVRFVLNTIRSIEPFVWALIFVTWFRLGPFPGMVALLVHSVAALGKLYSEQVESIDPGPVEAVRSTGATEFQTVLYAVVPQIIPPFISFTIYRWDINVRMSTIIGLVGGGGIGQMLFQYQNLAQWRSTSVAVILIVTVVMVLDNVSAKVRERIL
jgi:phosphonate ABC transporter permease subunit PhnE